MLKLFRSSPSFLNRICVHSFSGKRRRMTSRLSNLLYSHRKFSSKRTIKNSSIEQRKWSTDDAMAILSWILIGNGVFVFVSTTTFVSIWMGILKSFPFQDDLIDIACRKALSGYDLSFKFEKAQMQWSEGFLRLHNVSLCRNTNKLKQITEFDINIKEADFKLSLLSWMNGKGLLVELKLNGTNGVIDRRHLDFSKCPPSVWLTRKNPSSDDIHLSRLQIENLDLKILDYNDFRPYKVSVYRADIKQFRSQWLLLDLLFANSIVGEYDGALFSLNAISNSQTQDEGYRASKLRISNLAIDMLNTGVQGPFGWIKNGYVDIDFIISCPILDSQAKLSELEKLKAIGDEFEFATSKAFQEMYQHILDRKHLLKLKLGHLSKEQKKLLFNNASVENKLQDVVPKNIEIFVDFRFNHVRAEIPSDYNGGLSDVFVRAVVAYLNSQPTAPRYRKTSTPPLSTFIQLPLANFDGAWTIYQCSLINELSNKVTDALIKQVASSYFIYQQKGMKRNTDNTSVQRQTPSAGLLIKVAWWGVQKTSRAILNFWDFMSQTQYDPASHSDPEDETLSEVYDEFSRKS